MGDSEDGSSYISPRGDRVSPEDIPEALPTHLDDFRDKDESSDTGGSAPKALPIVTPDGGVSSGGAGGVGPVAVEPPEQSEPSDGGDDKEREDEDTPTGEPDQPDLPDEDPDLDDPEEEPDDEDEDEDDEEDEHQVVVVMQSDAWDNMGWGNEPIRLQIEEEYGDQVGIYTDLVPVRAFASPDGMKEKWGRDAKRHGMPVNTSVWDDTPPASTELADRAFLAAREQGLGWADAYLRRMRIAAIVEGTNIENKDVLVGLAEEVGLDMAQFQADWDQVEPKETASNPDTPTTLILADEQVVTQSGYLDGDDLKYIFEQAGLEEEEPQPLPGFVAEHGPVTVREVQQVYGWDHDKALKELQHEEGINPVELGNATFWARFG